MTNDEILEMSKQCGAMKHYFRDELLAFARLIESKINYRGLLGSSNKRLDMDTKNYGPEYIRSLIEEAPTTRELLQQALSALELAHPRFGIATQKHVEVIAAIRAHLEKPEPEPVAWMTEDKGNGQYAMWGQKPTSDYWLNHPEKLIPLYTKERL